MLKVLHFRSSSVLAGPERYVLELAGALQAYDFQAELLAYYRRKPGLPAKHPVLKAFRRRGLAARQLPDRAWFSFADVSRLARLLQAEEFALLHTHDYKADLIGGLAARSAKVPAVATVNGYETFTLRLRIYRILDLLALRFFARVIAVSESVRRELLAAGLAPNQVITIHHGLDSHAFSAGALARGQALRRQLGIGDESPLASIIGRLSPGKGHIDFLVTACRVLAARPDCRFLIVGDGPLRESLEHSATAWSLEDSVTFVGHQEDVAACIAASDIVVMASWAETFGYVLLESAALGKPIVATQVGGVPEIIPDRETGYLVPPRDPERLAAAVLHVLAHPQEARHVAQKGKERVHQKFSAGLMARSTAHLYRQILGS